METGRILIIEAEKKLTDDLKASLSDAGFDVVTAYDVKIGVQFLTTKVFDLIVLDTDLVQKDIDVVLESNRLLNNPIPVIFILSGMTSDNYERGNDANAHAFVIKPFEVKEFLFKIKDLLERTASGQPRIKENILAAADLVMNLDSRKVMRAGKQIDLTAKEFQLLEYMLRNRNRVLSRITLAINVWNIDFNPKTNVVDVYISYLRNKVDKPFNKKLIGTHVGMGYVLRDT